MSAAGIFSVMVYDCMKVELVNNFVSEKQTTCLRRVGTEQVEGNVGQEPEHLSGVEYVNPNIYQ